VFGEHTIIYLNGTQELRPSKASYYRFEKSVSLPFCDGAHKDK
jgi:CDGSH-type Zn-finger protein